ncbi:EamA family transporter [Chenggangzhangella methanolivorans]|uniref:EamA family transporter n=1 Tax=Chenggangzhangella methanolivorans TaxID=1437009 RepID=A0A9E6R7V3_9HYPH|nr:EamA family transporter [Chenggangzhangella methanolivorans]QZN98904.1 EamA family transporter [Chenggangzhangella methanolivorans]
MSSPAASSQSAGASPDFAFPLAVAALVGSIVALCVGTSFAKGLFAEVGAAGVTTLRVTISALILCALWRPWRARFSAKDLRSVALFGAVLGTMNLLFYLALRTVPLGITIAIEFSGPLAVAVAGSRRALDLVWVGLAVLGLGLLLPLGHGTSALDPVGVACALGAAACWAAYIILGKRVGHLHGGRTIALAMCAAALVTLPFGAPGAAKAAFDPTLLAMAAGVAVLSSAIPYSLEIFSLKHLPSQTFGVLLCLEPAVGSLAGLAILGERLALLEWIAIGAIVMACGGAAASAARRRPVPPAAVAP